MRMCRTVHNMVGFIHLIKENKLFQEIDEVLTDDPVP